MRQRHQPLEQERPLRLHVRRDHRGRWARYSPRPDPTRRTSGQESRPKETRWSASPRLHSRNRAPPDNIQCSSRQQARTHIDSSGPQVNSDNSQFRASQGQPSLSARNQSKQMFLARMVICTAFARLVSQSRDNSVNHLAERLLRQKIGSPLEAFLTLSLENSRRI